MKVVFLSVLLIYWVAFCTAQLGISFTGPSSSEAPPSSSVAPPASNTNSASAPPPSSAPPPASSAPPPASSEPPAASSDNSQPTASTRPTRSRSGGASATDTATDNAGPTSAPSSDGNNGSNGENNGGSSGPSAGTIAGAVVGGVVGLALIGGLVTWLNRRGGCTSRTKRRHIDNFDDFATGGDDLPNENLAGMAAMGASPASPFQRRLVPPTGQQQNGSYMNLGDEDYGSETSGMVNPAYSQPYGYPAHGDYYNQQPAMEMAPAWQQSQDVVDQQQHMPYDPAYPSPAMSQMKPDTVDHHKPHEV